MSSNDRPAEPIGGEPALARDRPARPASNEQAAAVNGDPRDEKSIVLPTSRVRTANPKRAVSRRLVPSSTDPGRAVDDSGSIALAADVATHDAKSANGTTKRNGAAKGTGAKGTGTKGTATTPKRRPQKAGDGGSGKRVPNDHGIDDGAISKFRAGLIDPGMIQAPPATEPPVAEPHAEPGIPRVVEPVIDDRIDIPIESRHLEAHELTERDAVAETLVTQDTPTLPGETTITSVVPTADGASPAVESSVVESSVVATPDVVAGVGESSIDDHPTDDHGIEAEVAATIPTTDDAPGQRSRKPAFGRLIARVKEALTGSVLVVPSAPATNDGGVGELPPPFAPPVIQPVADPLSPESAPEPLSMFNRAPQLFAPTGLQPRVPDGPSPTRLFPTTTRGIDIFDLTRPNYVDDHVGRDVDDDEPAMMPTIKRPVRTSAPAARRRPRIRRVTRVIRHVDPWSVFKVAVCFSTVLYGVCLTAGVLLWNVAYTTGTIDNIERFFESFGWNSFEFKGGELYHNAWIAGLFASIGLTGFIVLGATLFNLITDLVGGIRVTVLEEEVVERDPVARRQIRNGRRVELKRVIDPDDPDAPLESTGETPGSMVEPVWVEPARDVYRSPFAPESDRDAGRDNGRDSGRDHHLGVHADTHLGQRGELRDRS